MKKDLNDIAEMTMVVLVGIIMCCALVVGGLMYFACNILGSLLNKIL